MLSTKIYAVDEIRVRLGSANKAHYHSKGYKVYGEKFAIVRIEDTPENAGIKIPVVCPHCNQKRTTIKQKISIAGHTCCKACSKHLRRFQDITGKRFSRLMAIKPVGKDNDNATQWLCICDCGNETITSITRLNNGLTSSCGCLRTERTIEAVSGDKNVHYNPNLTQEHRMLTRGIPEYREWQRLVKERDNFTCQVCNQIGGRLASHHLYGWNEYEDLRFDIDNGVTLCHECHVDFHKAYGKGGNTKDQYIEWLGS